MKAWRYAFFSFAFVLGLVAVLARSSPGTPILLAAAVVAGAAAEWFDNRRDRPFQNWNVKHGHYFRGKDQVPLDGSQPDLDQGH